MYVIGTAGHVDHGKSTLVKALTDIDPDRLPEEKEREMTVDLGFAWMTLPSGREVSIVDVPGHERLIKNMLAGVGAIDLAMLIVAADESVMQQTREHLAILDILQIRRGLIVVTKTDLVDEELVELVKAEVEDVVAGTSFEGCTMIGVSAYTGAGLDELKATIDEILDDTGARRDLGRPRLPVDRCFSISGFGTVVTGTLIDGVFAIGQEVELAPSGMRGRIRGLQSHKERVDSSDPGVRLAVNLSGVARTDIERGEVVTLPGWLPSTRRLDARIRMVAGAPHPLRHNSGVTFHLFTSETTARVRLLDADRLAPSEEGWIQILLDDPIPMVKGDYFVLRSAEDTLGGGQVVDPNPRRRHRRFVPDTIEQLMMLDQGTGEDIIYSVADQGGPCDLRTIVPEVQPVFGRSDGAGPSVGRGGGPGGFGQPGDRERCRGLFVPGVGHIQEQGASGPADLPQQLSSAKGGANPGNSQPYRTVAGRVPESPGPAGGGRLRGGGRTATAPPRPRGYADP